MFVAFQQKTRKRQLLFLAIGNIFALTSNAFILNYVAVATFAVAFIKNISFVFLDGKRDRLKRFVPHTIFVAFCLLDAAGMFAAWWFGGSWIWFNYILLSSLFFITFTKTYKNVHWMKISSFINHTCMLINAAMFVNIMGGLAALIAIASIAIFYFVMYRSKKNTS